MGIRLQGRKDDGAVAVTVAIVLLVLFLITALIIDLGFTRSDARANQSHADFAALAAATLGPEASASDECRRAVQYFASNAPEVTEEVDPAPCDDLPETCDASTESVTTDPIVAGPYELLVTYPVDDSDPAMTGGEQAIMHERDGLPCDRLKTEVRRNRAYVFAPASGMLGGSSFGDAIVLRRQGGDVEDFASLIVVEPRECTAIRHNGGAVLDVVSVGTPGTEDYRPGIITIDSDVSHSSCTSGNNEQQKAIAAPSATGAVIRAADFIYSYGIRVNPANASKVFMTSSVNAGKLTPAPLAGRRITRAPMDHLFNCRSSYPPPGQPQLPNANQDVGPCPDEPELRAYIDELRAAVGPDTGTPPGFWASPTGSCPNTITYENGIMQWGGNDPVVHPNGRLRIRCETGTQTQMNLYDATHVIFDQKVEAASTFRIHGDPVAGAVVVFRHERGAVALTGGTVDLQDVFVYADSRANTGPAGQRVGVEIGGGAVLNWTAPISGTIRASCAVYNELAELEDPFAIPPAGCFSPLALWSNSEASHSIGGSGCNSDGPPVCTISGSFFTPNVEYDIKGGSGLNMRDAQFFTLRLLISGGGNLIMAPNPNTNVPIPLYETGLIR